MQTTITTTTNGETHYILHNEDETLDIGKVADVEDLVFALLRATGSKLLPTHEAGEIAGVTDRTLRYAARKGQIQALQLSNGQWVFTMSALRAWMQNRPKPGPKPKRLHK